jgi:hypothetical protein
VLTTGDLIKPLRPGAPLAIALINALTTGSLIKPLCPGGPLAIALIGPIGPIR